MMVHVIPSVLFVIIIVPPAPWVLSHWAHFTMHRCFQFKCYQLFSQTTGKVKVKLK